jgi:hypothetical protein
MTPSEPAGILGAGITLSLRSDSNSSQRRRQRDRQGWQDPRRAALSGHVRDALDEIAPAQRHELRHPQPTIITIIKKLDQGMVARPIFDRLEQREDLAFAQDPLGEFLLEGRAVDRGAGVEGQVPHPSRERQ